MTSTTGTRMKTMIADERGLTLIELCFVILILGLIVAMASPRLSQSYHKLKLKTTAEQVYRDLTMASRRATLSARPWRFRIWDDGSGYDLEEQISDYENDRPAWEADAKWQSKLRRGMQEGFVLHPEASTLIWSPNSRGPNNTLTLKSRNGDNIVYEIQIENGKVRLHERQGTMPDANIRMNTNDTNQDCVSSRKNAHFVGMEKLLR
ncbi:MAG: Tfp pilus assembly protein FimT/FimU [bacterium]